MKKLFFILIFFLPFNAIAGRPLIDSLAKEVMLLNKKPQSLKRDTLLVTAYWRYSYYSIYFHEKNAKLRLDSLENLTRRIKWKVGDGMLLINKSYYSSYFDNDFSNGLALCLKAKDLLENTKNYEALATAKLRIASIMLWNIQNIPENKNEFLKKGMKISEEIYELGRKTKNADIMCSGLIYEANYLNTSGSIPKTIETLKRAENLMTNQKVSYLTENLIYGMLSTTYSALKDSKNAIYYTEKTQNLAEKQQDYYSLLSIYRFKAELEIANAKLDKAQEYLEKSYFYAKKFETLKFISLTEGWLYGVHKYQNNKEKALEYLELYIKHEDSLTNEKTQKIYADYDLATKESKIQKLENQSLISSKIAIEKEINYLKIFKLKEDSLTLQKNNKIQTDYKLAKKEAQIKTLENEKLQTEANRNQLIRNILILSLFAGSGFALYLYKNNKNLIAKNREIKEALIKGQTIERKRVAQELHDNLSAKISGIRWRLESIQPKFETEKQGNIYNSTINALAEVYTDVRLISHNLLPEDLETKGLKVSIEKLIEELNSLGKTQFTIQISDSLGRYESRIEYEIFSLLLEISNNILKHSHAQEAIVSLEKFGNTLQLNISDNGVGLPENAEKKGMGMPNLRSRVASLKGKIDFINENGLKVNIQIPV
ncbi:hypothetical protein EGI22_02940 [Lacihabitans sp. LS3-19]|uniref:sensor histidine kinase n=1 Tax=Lacihabitans sp. LS3-19 TaxID=2487335 RepID=UPI0020CF5D4C|nr:histidine kinase [Lacihabitans sp. LS3-19]MCP9766848.1 hypothetical protein [Lacihabitans sp. LS3-19]